MSDYFCSCMLFGVYICGYYSPLSVIYTYGMFWKLGTRYTSICWNSRVWTYNLMSGLDNYMCTWLFKVYMRVDVNLAWVKALVVCDFVHAVGCPCRHAWVKISMWRHHWLTTGPCPPLPRPLQFPLSLLGFHCLWLWACQSGSGLPWETWGLLSLHRVSSGTWDHCILFTNSCIL